MAIVRKNSQLEGLSGRVGDLVFRNRGGRTIVAKRPVRKTPRAPSTEAREGTMSRFKQAVVFARDARHQPAFRSLCRQLRGASPYHLAIQDFLSVPSIDEVDGGAVGPSGGPLLVTVSEQIAVRDVRARLVGGQWLRGRVMGVATGKSGQREETQGKAVREEARRPSTPAEMFFRRTTADRPTTDRPTTDRATTDRPTASTRPPESGSQPGQSAATHPPGEGEPAGAEHSSGKATTWRIDLPGAGEVEISAWDYAGNQVTERRTIGTSSVEPSAK